MKNTLWVIGVLFLSLGLGCFGQGEMDYVPGEVVVGLQPGSARMAREILATSLRAYGGEVLAVDFELSAALVQVPAGQERSFIMSTRGLADVVYVEPNYIAYALDTPNDLFLPLQWGLVVIKAFSAWDIHRGDKKVLVAVVDTGVDYKHPELADAYVGGGYDFVDNDDDPHPKGKGCKTAESHGTHVAGIIAAISNNGEGIAGVAQVSIMAERVLGCDGFGTYWNVAKGIKHAADKGAKIINLSLGGAAPSMVLHEALKYAYQKGCLIVAAAGNGGRPPVIYPAAYDEALAVSATNINNKIAWFSSYGPQVELAAPGVLVLSTIPNEWYAVYNGTSMATPHVAGVAALIWSINPNLSRDEVRRILRETAVDLGPEGRDDEYGYGLVDAARAAAKAKETVGGILPPETRPSGWSISTKKDNYAVGEKVGVIYSVNARAEATIYRVGASDRPELLFSATVAQGTYELTPAPIAQAIGTETLVLQAKLPEGGYVNVARSYSIGGALSRVRISINKACGSTYKIGEMCTITIEAQEACTVTLYDFSTSGSVEVLVTKSMAADEKVTFSARVTGPAGTEALVVRAVSATGRISTASCQFHISR